MLVPLQLSLITEILSRNFRTSISKLPSDSFSVEPSIPGPTGVFKRVTKGGSYRQGLVVIETGSYCKLISSCSVDAAASVVSPALDNLL